MSRTTRGLHRRYFILVVLLGLAVLLPGLDRITMLRNQEFRVVCTAENMLQSGNWMLPEYQGHLRLQKPPGMYWVEAAVFKWFGHSTSQVVARLPSAGFGLLLATLVYFGGALLIGRQRARWAAAVTVGSFLFARHAGLAETDMPLTVFTAAAILCFWRGLNEPRRRTQWTIYAGVCMGAAFLFKGPAALAMPLLTLALFALLSGRREQRTRVTWRGALAAAILCAVIAAPWYLALFFGKFGDGAVRVAEAELAKMATGGGHPRPFYFYLYKLPIGLLPWGPLLFAAVWAAWRPARAHRGLRYLYAWWWSSFLLLSAVKTKQEHYATLLLPQSALLLGWFLGFGFRARADWRRAAARGYIRFILIALGLVGAAFLVIPFFEPAMHRGRMAVLGILLLGAAAWAFWKRPRYAVTLTLAVGMSLLMTYAYFFELHRFHRPASFVRVFAAEARPLIKQQNPRRIILAGRYRMPLSYYLGYGDDLPHVATLAEAFREAKPGELIIAAGDRKHPLDSTTLPAPPNIEGRWKGIHCALYIRSNGKQ